MNFLQPLFLAGILAAALPLIIHLINRRKAVRRSFPALKLLRESNERIARSVKVRQWLLLAMRALAIAFLAIALAKPYLLSTRGITAEERLPTAVVFVVENGFAMANGDWWDQSRSETRRRLSALRPWDEAAVVTTASEKAPLSRLTADHGEVRRALDSIERSFSAGDLPGALITASDILAGSELPNRRIVVLGSGTLSPIADTSRELHIAHPIEYIDLRRQKSEEITENLAIIQVDYAQDGPAQQGRWQIEAAVENFGAIDQKNVRIQLRVNDVVVAGGALDIPAGQTSSHVFEYRLEGSDLTPATVELIDADELSVDDSWHFLIRPRQRVRALLVNGAPSSLPYDDELFFMSRAMEVAAAEGGNFTTSLSTVDGLARRELNDFDVVVLANVEQLSQEQARELERFVQGGGGLLIAMGDQVDVHAYNNHLSELLPRPLRGLKLLAERNDPDAPVKITRLGHPQRQHPIFQSFGLPGSGSIQSVGVYSYMLLDPAPSDRESRLLLSYQDNAPALLERQVGQGRVLLFTSTLSRKWTDFPVRAAYLPLINRSLLYLARRATSGTAERHVVGEVVKLETGEYVRERAIIHTPDERRLVFEPLDGEVRFTPEMPGVYRFFADDDGGAGRNAVDSLSFAANLDRRGSKLHPLPPELFESWQSDHEGAQAELRGGHSGERRVNLWSRLLFVVTLALLAETVLGSRRSVLVQTWERLRFWRR